MLFGAPQLPEEPAREWAASLQRSIAEYDWNPVTNSVEIRLENVQTHRQYLWDFLYPIPIIFSDVECGPRYVLQDAAIAVNCSDGAIPLVSSGDEEIDSLVGWNSDKLAGSKTKEKRKSKTLRSLKDFSSIRNAVPHRTLLCKGILRGSVIPLSICSLWNTSIHWPEAWIWGSEVSQMTRGWHR
jgi:hypothetical protein